MAVINAHSRQIGKNFGTITIQSIRPICQTKDKRLMYSNASYAQQHSHRMENYGIICKSIKNPPVFHARIGSQQCLTEHESLHDLSAKDIISSTDEHSLPIDDEHNKEVVAEIPPTEECKNSISEEQINNMTLDSKIIDSSLGKKFGKMFSGITGELLDLAEKQEFDTTSSPIENCPHCPFETSQKFYLMMHKKMHSESDKRSYKCTFCTFSCLSAISLQSHLGLHTMVSNKTKICRYFPKSNIENRREHIKLLQQRLTTTIKRSSSELLDQKDNKSKGLKKRDKYKCDTCWFYCDSYQANVTHMELHGNNVSIFKCSLCDYSSNTRNVLLFHEQNHHVGMTLTVSQQDQKNE